MSNDSKVLLRLNNVGVSYRSTLTFSARKKAGQERALSGLDLEVRSGETLGVIGRNGAGKSTLMAVLADIIAPDEGSVERFTKRVQLLSLRVGFMRDLTGRQNVTMAGLLLGLRRREIEARIPAIVDFSELGDKIDQPIRTYSTGMLARLGFAVATQSDPDVLLIDEVLGVGDASFRPKTNRIINERIDSGEAVVIVSHAEETIRNYCDRVAWIDHGQLRMVGSAEDVLAVYRDLSNNPGPK